MLCVKMLYGMVPEMRFYENTLHNLGLYLVGEGVGPRITRQVVSQFKEFHGSLELSDIFGQTPDLLLAGLPRRYLHGKPYILVQLGYPTDTAGLHLYEFSSLYDQKLVQPIEKRLLIGCEIVSDGKMLPFRTSMGALTGKHPNLLGILRGSTI